MLKTSKKVTVTCQDWDEFVVKTYGRPYCFQQQDGCRFKGTMPFSVPADRHDITSNDRGFGEKGVMGVSFKSWLERDPKKPFDGQKYDFELEMWWHRNFYPSLSMIINDLHARGLLEEGEYTMIIDW